MFCFSLHSPQVLWGKSHWRRLSVTCSYGINQLEERFLGEMTQCPVPIDTSGSELNPVPSEGPACAPAHPDRAVPWGPALQELVRPHWNHHSILKWGDSELQAQVAISSVPASESSAGPFLSRCPCLLGRSWESPALWN